MTVRILNQEEADVQVRRLYGFWNPRDAGSLFRDVFSSEDERAAKGLDTWALPENERTYFIAHRNSKTYLYGINLQYSPHAFNISSIGNITPWKHLHSTKSLTIESKSVLCLRELIGKLIPLAKEKQKKRS
jgi:hypothetical protein